MRQAWDRRVPMVDQPATDVRVDGDVENQGEKQIHDTSKDPSNDIIYVRDHPKRVLALNDLTALPTGRL